MTGLFNELKRRNVVRVGIAYVVLGWVVIQIAQLLFEAFGTPDWVIKTVIVLIAIGFPFALLFAWAFELTPDGLKKTRDVDASASITPSTGRKLDFVIIGALVVALGYFVWERQQYQRVPAADTVTEAEADGDDAVVPANTAANRLQRSVAVLPFVNMSDDKEQEYFADGLTEEILNSLAKTPDLLVAARTSSFSFKGASRPVQEIAAELGVGHILEGSVRRGGDRLRITAQLIRASDGFHVWSETFDRTIDDIITVQEEIGVQIARALETTMDPEELERMMRSGTTSVAAYEAYVTAQGIRAAAFASGDSFELLGAKEAYEKAIELDPEFAEAYWALSNFWYLQTQTNQLYADLTDLSREEINARLDDTFSKAIRFEKDEITRIRYRAAQADGDLDLLRSVQLAEEYLAARPGDEDFFSIYMQFMAGLRMSDKIAEAARERYVPGELTTRQANSFMQVIRAPEHRDLLRQVTVEAVDRYGDNVALMYQAHRALLWAADVDGASRLLPRLLSSDLDEENRLLVELRQSCAEGRPADANRLMARISDLFRDRVGVMWLALEIIGDTEAAAALFDEYDEAGDFGMIQSYLTYPNFDPTRYRNFMNAVRGQGFEKRQVIDLPYRCARDEAI